MAKSCLSGSIRHRMAEQMVILYMCFWGWRWDTVASAALRPQFLALMVDIDRKVHWAMSSGGEGNGDQEPPLVSWERSLHSIMGSWRSIFQLTTEESGRDISEDVSLRQVKKTDRFLHTCSQLIGDCSAQEVVTLDLHTGSDMWCLSMNLNKHSLRVRAAKDRHCNELS